MRPIHKKLLLPVLALFLLPALSLSQTPSDEVHLLSGLVHKGIVIEQKPGESIRLLRLPQGDTLTFAMDEIDRITRILPVAESQTKPPSLNQSPVEPQFNSRQNIVMVQGSIGGGDYSFEGFGLTLSHRLNARGKTWLGLGVHYIGYTDEGADAVQIFPLMADFRQEFNRSRNGRFSTQVFLDAGYVFSITGNGADQYGEFKYGNGWAFNPGIAFKINILRNAGLMLDIGWMHHGGPRQWLPPTDEMKDYKNWNNILFRGSLFF